MLVSPETAAPRSSRVPRRGSGDVIIVILHADSTLPRRVRGEVARRDEAQLGPFGFRLAPRNATTTTMPPIRRPPRAARKGPVLRDRASFLEWCVDKSEPSLGAHRVEGRDQGVPARNDTRSIASAACN